MTYSTQGPVRKAGSLIAAVLAGVALLLSKTTAQADVVIYTGPGGDTPGTIFNVKSSYNGLPGAKGDGAADDTAAIRRAINAILIEKRAPERPVNAGHHTLYFPNGTYRVTGPLTFGSETTVPPGGKTVSLQTMIHIKGQSRDYTVIRLDNGTFPANNPRPVLSFLDAPESNDSFGNTIEDLTINVGMNNPGAIALRYHNNNYGYVQRVTLRSGDGQGKYGLELGSGNAGIGLVKDIEVRGFDYGIVNQGAFKITYVLEHVTLSDQNQGGILTRDKGLSVRRLHSTNRVPALVQSSDYASGEDDNGQVVIVGSTLEGVNLPNNNDVPAINNIDGWVLARGLTVSGYGQTLRDHGLARNFGFGGEYVTDGVNSLWPNSTPNTTLNLPIDETPGSGVPGAEDVPQDPQSSWRVVDTDDPGPDGNPNLDSDILQAAIDSGKNTVFLKRGDYTISNTILLKNNLRRFNGNWSFLELTDTFAKSGKPIFEFQNGAQPVVVLEALDHKRFTLEGSIYLQNDASRTLVMRDLHGRVKSAYRNSGTGKLFVESVFTSFTADPNLMDNRPGWEFTNQQVWARAINHEGSWPHFVNNGGKLWILGFKGGEGHGPYFRTTSNGSGRGQTEVLGGIMNNLAIASDYPNGRAAIEIVDSDMSISAMETSLRYDFQGEPTYQQPHPITVKETRGNDTRQRLFTEFPPRRHPRLNGRVVPLYRGGQ